MGKRACVEIERLIWLGGVMDPEQIEGRKRLGRRLVGVFALALLMGPGPGIYLVNPSSEDAVPLRVLGMPVLYVWAVFWFLVMAATVVTAYRKLWVAEGDA